MTPAEALARHQAKRPMSPGAVGSSDPRWIAYHHDLQIWVLRKAQLELLHLTPTVEPAVIQHVGTKSPQKPAWAGATPEYMAQKQRESRERRGCMDCGSPRIAKRSRCTPCQEKNDLAQAEYKSERRRKIRAGLRERKEAA